MGQKGFSEASTVIHEAAGILTNIFRTITRQDTTAVNGSATVASNPGQLCITCRL